MCALRLDSPPAAVDKATERRTRRTTTSAAARTLTASRIYLEAADAVERLEHELHRRDFAGYDVLRASGLTADEAKAAWQQLVHDAIEEIATTLRDRADHDFDRAIASIGAAVRAERRADETAPKPRRRRGTERRHSRATRVR
ncbi:MAG: hypothetical protein RL238_2273 [Actinomycetota bacterium]